MTETPDPRIVYADIIGLPHWQSPVRPRMSMNDRAAQFLSYKALTGFEDVIAEEARTTEELAEPGTYETELLNRQLSLIAGAAAQGKRPVVSFRVFVPDERKAGGRYEEIADAVRRVDPVGRKVVLASAEGNGRQYRTIPFENIVSVSGDLKDMPDGG